MRWRAMIAERYEGMEEMNSARVRWRMSESSGFRKRSALSPRRLVSKDSYLSISHCAASESAARSNPDWGSSLGHLSIGGCLRASSTAFLVSHSSRSLAADLLGLPLEEPIFSRYNQSSSLIHLSALARRCGTAPLHKYSVLWTINLSHILQHSRGTPMLLLPLSSTTLPPSRHQSILD